MKEFDGNLSFAFSHLTSLLQRSTLIWNHHIMRRRYH
jgi:hypothetical protein